MALTLVRNPNYFVPGLPYIDRVEVLVDEDNASRMAAFLGGKYDLGWEFPGTINRTDWVQIKDTLEEAAPEPADAGVPVERHEPHLACAPTRTPFSDVARPPGDVARHRPAGHHRRHARGRRRRATAPCRPRSRSGRCRIDQLGEGATLLSATIPPRPSGSWPPPAIPTGFPARVLHDLRLDGAGRQHAARPQGPEDVGIDAKLDQKEYGAYHATLLFGKFDSMAFGPQTPFLEPDNFLFGQYYPGEPRNQSHVNDPVLDDLLVRQRRTLDVKARRDVIHEIQRHLAKQQYYVQLRRAPTSRCGTARSRTTRPTSATTTAGACWPPGSTAEPTLGERQGDLVMTTRRDFLQTTAGALAGLVFVGCDLMAAAPARAQARRREVVVNGKRVKTVDVHAHCAVPEALALMNLKLGGPALRPDLDMATQVSVRLQAMDEQGIDVEALSINPNWYKAGPRPRQAGLQLQNEKLAEACAANPERFVAFATVALQHPDLAAEQLEEGVKKYGLRGAGIGGNVNGEEISDPKFHPFWAKAEQLGVVVFIHPQGDGAPAQLQQRFKGNGYLGNVIGNPLETTIALSHLIFEGTLDKFPGLKICAAHAGGFLPSYAGRSDFGCPTRPDLCPGGTHGPIKKKPTEYLKQLYYDTMVFNAEGVRHLAAEVGASQLMVGTDFPYPWTKTAVDLILKTPGLSDADRTAILGGTAAKLLGIKS